MQAIDHSEVVNVTREQKARGIRLRDSVLSIPDDIDMRDPVSCFCDPSGSSNDNVFHTQVRRVLGLVNPKSGGGKALRRWRKLAAKLEANDIETEVHETQSAADFTLIAACCDLRNLCDVLVVVGGDGTLHELTQGFALRAVLENSNRVIECPVPVCILAAGTGNNVLRTMGALDTETVAQALIRGSYRYIDVFRCHLCERDTVDDAVAVECPDFLSGPLGPREFPSQQQCQQYLQLPLDSVRVKFAINNLAWALGVDTTRSAEHHRWARLMRYDIGAVSSLLRYRHHRATLIVDGREIASQDWDYIGAQNNQHGRFVPRMLLYFTTALFPPPTQVAPRRTWRPLPCWTTAWPTWLPSASTDASRPSASSSNSAAVGTCCATALTTCARAAFASCRRSPPSSASTARTSR
ncbi:MAG: hypothetical protein MHM6MM_001241 [Cercozoa sp. M6MM]